MSRKPNIHGGGSRTNLNGLNFEGRTDFKQSLKNNNNFSFEKIPTLKKTYNVIFKKKKQVFTLKKMNFISFF